MSDETPGGAQELMDDFSLTHRIWVYPVLRALADLGGKARPMVVDERIHATSAAHLNPFQWAHIRRGNHIRWARFGMTQRGLVTAEHGIWAITDAGRNLLAELAGNPGVVPDSIPELSQDEAGNLSAELTTMPVTNYDGYHVPILTILAERGVTSKQELTAELGKRLASDFLPGDRGTLPQGTVLWRYRASWALTAMKKAGELRNSTVGSWDITETGKARLAAEKASWSFRAFQNSKAKVRPPRADDNVIEPDSAEVEVPVAVGWTIERWRAASSRLGSSIHRALDLRLRPDLGPTPSLAQGTLARNLIFYGPPGTGKTYLASQAAIALTGDTEPGEDSHWQIVQFHPSYAYEDFIQGLRPDLEQPELRYKLSKGPFLQICERASEEPDEFFVLLIDEINRGDPARIFGELLYGLEYRGQSVGLSSGGELSVPQNLIVLGTMNSVDRSVALVDYALRRRFAFVRVGPDPDVIRAVRGENPLGSVAAEVLESFNRWITGRLGREHVLGHSIFLNPAIALNDAASLETVWDLDVAPLLEEYFFGEPGALAEARVAWKSALDTALVAREAVEDDEDEIDVGSKG